MAVHGELDSLHLIIKIFFLFTFITDHSQDIYTFADTLVTPDHVQDKVYIRQHKTKNTPIVIDNGSWQCRSGWASQHKPCLRFRNALARMRAKKVNICLVCDHMIFT